VRFDFIHFLYLLSICYIYICISLSPFGFQDPKDYNAAFFSFIRNKYKSRGRDKATSPRNGFQLLFTIVISYTTCDDSRDVYDVDT